MTIHGITGGSVPRPTFPPLVRVVPIGKLKCSDP
jgi:hypothetical protein